MVPQQGSPGDVSTDSAEIRRETGFKSECVNTSDSSLRSFPCFLEVTTPRSPETSRGAHDSELCGQHFVDEGQGMSHTVEGFAGLKPMYGGIREPGTYLPFAKFSGN